MKKIVITNAYGYKNIGDGAILDSAINIINKAIDKSTIDIHTATHFTVKANKENSPRTLLHPYGIAIKTKDNPISDSLKLVRFSQVVLISLFYAMIGKIFPNVLPNGDYSYIRSIKEADIVFGIGGGYFRTKNKYKDYFGLLLTLLPIFIAHIYNKRLLYLPMSYGNFASALQDKIVFNLIKNDSIILRDEISLRAYQKNSSKKLETHLIPDLALFDDHNTPKGRREN